MYMHNITYINIYTYIFINIYYIYYIYYHYILYIKNKNKLTTDLYIKLTDTHQYLDYTFSHPEHTKKSIVYGQTLRLCQICFFETDFVKRKNEMK